MKLRSAITTGLVWILLALLGMLPAAVAQDRPPPPAQRILDEAHAQVGVTVRYDPSYQAIAFPGGDVPRDRGVCSDVIIRTYRSVGIDLQVLVNRDMRQAFDAYPRLWGLARPDPNIDHRRVPNLAVFLARHGKALPVSTDARDYLAGDLVTWRLPAGQPHIGLVSDRLRDGRPLIIHNIGDGARVEDILFAFQITGHYRYLPER